MERIRIEREGSSSFFTGDVVELVIRAASDK